MIKNLFSKHDHRNMPGITKEQVMQAAGWYWRSRQFGVTYTSPFSLRGGQFYSKLGLRQSVDVYAVDEGQNTGVDVTLSAELTDEGAAVGVVGAILLLPVTVAVGAISYIEYENGAQALMNEFWSYLCAFPKNPTPPSAPSSSPSRAQGQAQQPVVQVTAPPSPRSCPSCKSALDSDSKFCKFCGARV